MLVNIVIRHVSLTHVKQSVHYTTGSFFRLETSDLMAILSTQRPPTHRAMTTHRIRANITYVH